jgi:hypothetical protein
MMVLLASLLVASAAMAQAPTAPAGGWQRVFLPAAPAIARGQYDAMPGALEIPAGWPKQKGEAGSDYYFEATGAKGLNGLFLALRRERHVAGESLEAKAKAVSREISHNSQQFKVLSHDYTTIAGHAAYIVSLNYAETPGGPLQRNDVAIVDEGAWLDLIQVGGPDARVDELDVIFTHALSTLALAGQR